MIVQTGIRNQRKFLITISEYTIENIPMDRKFKVATVLRQFLVEREEALDEFG